MVTALADRAIFAPSLRELNLYYPGCAGNCLGDLGRTTAFMTAGQAADPNYRSSRDDDQRLQPGVAYYATLHQEIPQGVALNRIEMCYDPVVSPRRCIPLGPLPELGHP